MREARVRRGRPRSNEMAGGMELMFLSTLKIDVSFPQVVSGVSYNNSTGRRIFRASQFVYIYCTSISRLLYYQLMVSAMEGGAGIDTAPPSHVSIAPSIAAFLLLRLGSFLRLWKFSVRKRTPEIILQQVTIIAHGADEVYLTTRTFRIDSQ